jgi:hypothetical protein
MSLQGGLTLPMGRDGTSCKTHTLVVMQSHPGVCLSDIVNRRKSEFFSGVKRKTPTEKAELFCRNGSVRLCPRISTMYVVIQGNLGATAIGRTNRMRSDVLPCKIRHLRNDAKVSLSLQGFKRKTPTEKAELFWRSEASAFAPGFQRCIS